MFRKLDLLPSSGEAKEGEDEMTKPTQLGPLATEASFF
jgi:hypothetical protein